MEPIAREERILVVDDARDTLEVLQRNLSSKGFTVFTASSVAEGIRIIESTPIDLVITDLKMPKVNGLDLIRHVRENFKNTEVMMITGYATVQGAVTAVKTGAEEYLTKPFTDEELFASVRRTLDKLCIRMSGHSHAQETPLQLQGFIGESKAMQKVFNAIIKAASTSATVLITGESGTGKELVARAIHYNSTRASAPFIAINCGAIPEGLLESELFGYVRGAFTGANQSRAGFFQTADQGTIFLDEISETSLSMQVKLLRVLQEKEIFMVGSSRPIKVDIRILASTNKDLLGLLKKGGFREDLFYRLNVISMEVPTLRERENDILLLANHFITKFSIEIGKTPPRLSDKASQVLKNYDWPGNVRELENVIQRLIVMTDRGIIDVPDLPSNMRFSALRETGLNRTLAKVETEHILNVLAGVNGNRTRAAEILGIDRKTLREKVKKIQFTTSV
ncbi:Regulatory protein AtoC [subsurface metagenome]